MPRSPSMLFGIFSFCFLAVLDVILFFRRRRGLRWRRVSNWALAIAFGLVSLGVICLLFIITATLRRHLDGAAAGLELAATTRTLVRKLTLDFSWSDAHALTADELRRFDAQIARATLIYRDHGVDESERLNADRIADETERFRVRLKALETPADLAAALDDFRREGALLLDLLDRAVELNTQRLLNADQYVNATVSRLVFALYGGFALCIIGIGVAMAMIYIERCLPPLDDPIAVPEDAAASADFD